MPIAYRARDGQLTFNLDEYRLACALNLVRACPEHALTWLSDAELSIENWICNNYGMIRDRLLNNRHLNLNFINTTGNGNIILHQAKYKQVKHKIYEYE